LFLISRGYTFAIKLHTLNDTKEIMDHLTWISSRLKIGAFIDWAEKSKYEYFSYEIFRRAKTRARQDPDKLTDRQTLLIELAAQFVEQEKAAAQMSLAE